MDEKENHSALTLTDSNFDQEVLQFDGAVLVDFWAAWCGPCQMMAPRVEALAAKLAGNAKIKVGKLNVDENEETAMHYRIMSLPTFKIFKQGEEVAEIIGGQPIEQIEARLMEVA